MGQLHPVRQPSSIITLTSTYQEILSVLASPAGKVTKLDELKIALMNVSGSLEHTSGFFDQPSIYGELRWNDGTNDHILSRHLWLAQNSTAVLTGEMVTASGGTTPSQFLSVVSSKLQVLASDFYVGTLQFLHSLDDVAADDGLGTAAPSYLNADPAFPLILGDSESIKFYMKVLNNNYSVVRMRRQFIANAVKDAA